MCRWGFPGVKEERKKRRGHAHSTDRKKNRHEVFSHPSKKVKAGEKKKKREKKPKSEDFGRSNTPPAPLRIE